MTSSAWCPGTKPASSPRHARAAASILGALAFAACTHAAAAPLPTGTVRLTSASAGTATLHVQIADTEPARQEGLMHRSRLGTDDGMAFLFARPSTRSFWMKDTAIPLSAAFWARGGRIVAILEMTPCRTDPCPLYSPGAAYVGAVEANAGWFVSHGLAVGDTVRVVRGS